MLIKLAPDSYLISCDFWEGTYNLVHPSHLNKVTEDGYGPEYQSETSTTQVLLTQEVPCRTGLLVADLMMKHRALSCPVKADVGLEATGHPSILPLARINRTSQ